MNPKIEKIRFFKLEAEKAKKFFSDIFKRAVLTF
jgi:hypothetical protein